VQYLCVLWVSGVRLTMGDRSRSRSRSPQGKGAGKGGPMKTVEEVSKLAKEGNSEADIVNVAIKQLPGKIRERLEKLFEEGLLKENDLDLRSITVFASLNEGLQDRVMTHMECERIYVANARSKSGFLIATCDKAKTGCLDARGLGAIDPWRSALVAMATPKQKQVDLEPERDWIDKHGTDPIKLKVKLGACEKEVGMAEVTVEVPLNETAATVKSKLASLGIESIPTNKMKLQTEPVGYLKDRYSLAYYNLKDGDELELSARQRAGVKFRKDHAVPLKRPKTYDRVESKKEEPKVEAKAAPKPGGLPGLAGGLPGMPGLPGLPGLGGAGGLPGLPGMPKLPGMPGMPGLSMPAGGAAGAMPGLPGLQGAGGASMPKLPGLTMPGLSMPGMAGLPGAAGTSPSFDAKAAMLAMSMPGAGAAGKAPGGMPNLGGINLTNLPKLPGMPDLSALMGKAGAPGSAPGGGPPGLAGMAKGMPTMPGMGATAKAPLTAP